MRTINISFNPLDTWKRGDFRDFIKKVNDTDNINLYIIAYDASSEFTDYIDSVGSILGLDNTRILTQTTINGVVADVVSNSIDVHFDANNLVITEINDNLTDVCNPILVRYAPDSFADPTYITDFDRILEDLLDA